MFHKNSKSLISCSWKDPNNIFRTDERFRIRCVPTLLCWTTVSHYGS